MTFAVASRCAARAFAIVAVSEATAFSAAADAFFSLSTTAALPVSVAANAFPNAAPAPWPAFAPSACAPFISAGPKAARDGRTSSHTASPAMPRTPS